MIARTRVGAVCFLFFKRVVECVCLTVSPRPPSLISPSALQQGHEIRLEDVEREEREEAVRAAAATNP